VNAQLSLLDLPLAMPIEKAQATRRANVARNIDDGLISETPAARNTDPETSHEAVDHIHETGQRAAHQKIVLEMVLKLPGLTYRELGVQTGLERHAVMRRLHDLVDAGRVVKGEKRQVGKLKYTTWWPV